MALTHSSGAPGRVLPRRPVGWIVQPWRPAIGRAQVRVERQPAHGAAGRIAAKQVALTATARVVPAEIACSGPAKSVALRAVRFRMPATTPSVTDDAATDAERPNEIRDIARHERDHMAERLWTLLQPPLHALIAPNGALDWPAEIRPFQREGVAILLERREVLLADEMGLGKTVQTAAALRIMAFRGVLGAALVVCPASLLIQWYRELRRWAPELVVALIRGRAEDRATLWRVPAHVRLVSYDTLRGDVLDVRDSPVLAQPWDVVVLDEASRIKNRETGVSMACRRLLRDRRWVLTGTPLENRPEDVATILEFLLGDPQRPRAVRPDSATLREHLSRVQLRRKKADVLPELPPKDVNEVWLELHPRQRLAYDEAEQAGIVRLKSAVEPVSVTHVLELISRLKQICNRDPVSSESAKLDDISSRLDEIAETGQRALVFSQYTDTRFGVRWLAEELARWNPIEFTGAMSAAQRQRAVDTFQRNADHKVMVLSLRAGGLGLNLQSASYVFHMDRWWG
ncbi:MAG: hypothetical protein FJX72_15420, partial [Armatimonadetes bacterium]|nr:hypothetical protein [Armatimonadota bacterium]